MEKYMNNAAHKELLSNDSLHFKLAKLGQFLPSFSPREQETLIYLLQGATIKEIAQKVGIMPRTAQTYIDNIKMKLGVNRISKIIILILRMVYTMTT